MRITSRQIGVAAVVLLAPGGFILGAALIAARYRHRKTADPGDAASTLRNS